MSYAKHILSLYEGCDCSKKGTSCQKAKLRHAALTGVPDSGESDESLDEMGISQVPKFLKTIGKRKYRKYLAPEKKREREYEPIPKGIFDFT